jgi:hypothetical protein
MWPNCGSPQEQSFIEPLIRLAEKNIGGQFGIWYHIIRKEDIKKKKEVLNPNGEINMHVLPKVEESCTTSLLHNKVRNLHFTRTMKL